MIYFSDLRRKKVVTEDEVPVGSCEDIIFLAQDTPLVTKMVIRSRFGQKLIVPVKYLIKLNTSIVLKKSFENSTLEENELHVVKNLLDKQIIDLKGSKIIRVNDVILQDKGDLYIAGVDIGLMGILRWFFLERFISNVLDFFHVKITSEFLSWADIQPLELVRGKVKLRKKEEKLEKVKPEDLASYLEKTNVANASKFLRILDEKKAASVITHLNLNYQAALFRNFKPERAAFLLSFLYPDDAVDILLTLSARRRDLILGSCDDKKKRELLHLMNLSSTSFVGSLLTTEFLTVKPTQTVREVVNKIKKETVDFSFLTTVYVVNENNQLIGVFSLHELLLQDLDTPVYKFAIQNLVVGHLTSPKEIILRKMIKYKLQCLPIIDDQQHIQGIVSLDDISDMY